MSEFKFQWIKSMVEFKFQWVKSMVEFMFQWVKSMVEFVLMGKIYGCSDLNPCDLEIYGSILVSIGKIYGKFWLQMSKSSINE